MKKSVLREYAKLIVRVGANVQKGQTVLLHAGLDQPEFVQMVVVILLKKQQGGRYEGYSFRSGGFAV